MREITDEVKHKKEKNRILLWTRAGRPRMFFESKKTFKDGDGTYTLIAREGVTKIVTKTFNIGRNKTKLSKAERKQAIRRKRYEKKISQEKEIINQETQVAE